MQDTEQSPPPLAERWTDPEAGRRYAGGRWASARRAGRDLALVERMLDRAGDGHRTVLDAPCGGGRLFPLLRRRAPRLVGLDVSPPMLAEASGEGARVLRGDVFRLPFAEGAFDAVVCCRLLHHLDRDEDLRVAVSELVRVSRGHIVASFWDRASLPAWRRRLGLKRGGTRVARSRAELRAAFEAAGARVLGYAHSMRWISQQAFLLARKDRARP